MDSTNKDIGKDKRRDKEIHSRDKQEQTTQDDDEDRTKQDETRRRHKINK